MRKRLHFNSLRASQDVKAVVEKAADDLIREYYAEVYSRLGTLRGKSQLEIMSENEETIIKKKVVGYANAIMDSYGTGSKMDKNNPALADYMDGDTWNSIRNGLSIAGREEGTYKNIYGETAYSKGEYAGVDLEVLGVVKPVVPSYAFQQADVWFFGGKRVAEVLDYALKKFFSPSNMKQYFEFN